MVELTLGERVYCPKLFAAVFIVQRIFLVVISPINKAENKAVTFVG